jgi:hypothetical protein
MNQRRLTLMEFKGLLHSFAIACLLLFIAFGATAEPGNAFIKVFLKTDKQIYAPGDKIALNAKLFQCDTELPLQQGELLVMIKREKGEILVDQKYQVANGVVNAEIEVPIWAEEGMAYVVAFTPEAMLFSQALLTGIQPIAINTLRKNDYALTLDAGDKLWKPNDELLVGAELIPITPGNKKEKVTAILSDFKGELIREPMTLQTGTNKLKFKIPASFDRALYLEVFGQEKHFIYQKIPIRTTKDAIRLEFFPEGGHLLTNTIQKIVYRATNPFGEPTEVTGKVYDEGGHYVGVGKMIKPGYGLISLMPMPGQKYTFVVDSEYGADSKFEIPETIVDGAVLSYLKTENGTLRFVLRTSGSVTSQELTVNVYSASALQFSHSFHSKAEMRLDVPTNDLPKGILRISIANSQGAVLTERLVYNIEPLGEGLSYQPILNASPPAKEITVSADGQIFSKSFHGATFDMKVVDKFSLFDNYTSVPNSFLRYPLTMNFPVTVLDIYLVNIELIANRNLSQCKENSNDTKGKNIRGTVLDKKGKPVAGASVVAVHPNYSNTWKTESDHNGNFLLEGLTKSSELKVKAFDKSGKKSFDTKLFHSFDESLEELIRNQSFTVKNIYRADETARYFEHNRESLKDLQAEIRSQQNKRSENIERMLQSGTSILEVIKMMKPFHIQNNQIVFYGSENSLNFQSGALIVIDGQKMGTDISSFNIVTPSDVKSIQVSTNPMDIQKYTGLNSVGVIEIWTRGYLEGRTQTPNNQQSIINEKDSKPTRLWLPGIQSPSGEITLKYYPGTLKTDFRIQVDAVSGNGLEISSFIDYPNP